MTFNDDVTIVGGSVAVTELALGSDATTVALTARTGAITDGGDVGADVTASELALRAAGGIGSSNALDTAVSTVAASNTGSGNIVIENSVGGLLTIGIVDTLPGVSNSASGGNIEITNASPMDRVQRRRRLRRWEHHLDGQQRRRR